MISVTTEAQEAYARILNWQYIEPRIFMHEMVQLIDRFPDFLPPYAEVLELLEGQRRTQSYTEFLALTNQIAHVHVSDPARFDAFADMDFSELWGLYCIAYRLGVAEEKDVDVQKEAWKTLAKQIRHKWRAYMPESSGVFLDRAKSGVPVSAIHQALVDRPHLWYGTTPKTYHHAHQQFVLVRTSTHDSFATEPASMYRQVISRNSEPFDELIEHLEAFATERSRSLGLVRLFGLRPRRMVYRHADERAAYGAGERFHLVIASEGENPVMVGTDTACMKSGEIWAYDNRVPHKAYNLSDIWRIHAVFDLHSPPRAAHG